MKMKLFVMVVTLSLLLSGMLVTLGDEATKGEIQESVDGNIGEAEYVDFGTFEYGEDELDLDIRMKEDKTARWVFYGDGEKLESIETNDVEFDWSGHGNFEEREFRVEIEEYSDVVRIDWSRGDLKGEIPIDLSDLDDLTYLRLDNNHLSGDIPAELSDIDDLRILLLGSNDLTGEIPIELSDLKSLERLSLYENDLSGKIPIELSHLENLETLRLEDNELTGEIPSELSALENLEQLSLYENNLSGEIPSELSDLENLEILRLDNNHLSGEIPSELSDLENLARLDLYSNELSGGIPSKISELTELERVALQDNELRSYGEGAFSAQPDLGDVESPVDIIDICGNELSTEDVDNVLSDLVKSLDVEDRIPAEVDLTENSDPSEDGWKDKDILEDKDWDVSVDGEPPKFEYELTVFYEEGGYVEVDSDEVETGYTEEYLEGTKVELDAISDDGWGFDGWTGAHEGPEEDITIQMDEDKEITAHFEEKIEIHDWHDLDEVRSDLSGHYVLMNNLDEDTEGYDELVDTEEGWDPIRDYDNGFTGNFDGQGHKISDLYIDRPDEGGVGLFGMIAGDGGVTDVSIVEADITGEGNVGALVGYNVGSNLFYTGVTGNVIGVSSVGGLVGVNGGVVKHTSAGVEMSGHHHVGGLVGMNDGQIERSYAAEEVSGEIAVGGLIGENDGIVKNSYATGEVSGDNQIGGLVGSNDGQVENSYAAGKVSGDMFVGGLIGVNEREPSVRNSFWDIETSGQNNSDGGIGKNTAEMKDIATFTNLSTAGLSVPWDFVGNPYDDEGAEDIWDIDEDEEINDGYPFFVWAYYYTLTIDDITGEGTVEVDGEEVTETPFEKDYEQDETADLFAEPDEGWYFVDWEGINGSEADINLAMDEDVTIGDVVFEEYVTLTIDEVTGEGTVEVDGEEVTETPFEKDYERSETADLFAEPDEGWYFDEWKGTEETGEEITITMDEDKGITAVFEEEEKEEDDEDEGFMGTGMDAMMLIGIILLIVIILAITGYVMTRSEEKTEPGMEKEEEITMEKEYDEGEESEEDLFEEESEEKKESENSEEED